MSLYNYVNCSPTGKVGVRMCVRPYVCASVRVFVCMCVTVGREVGSSVNARLDSVLRQLFIFSLTRRLPGQTNFFCYRYV